MNGSEQLIERIRAAFAATPRPGDAFLAGSTEGCEPGESVAVQAGKRRSLVTVTEFPEDCVLWFHDAMRDSLSEWPGVYGYHRRPISHEELKRLRGCEIGEGVLVGPFTLEAPH